MDLNVLPAYRRRGIATSLMDAAESEAGNRASKVGIRVGLHSGYGAAQRLYVQRGYIPDGAGEIRDGQVVEEGKVGPLDDDLTLRMMLDLEKEDGQPMIDPELTEKVVLVTGANTGIGAAVAEAFGSQGCIVVLHYLGSADPEPEPGARVEHMAPGRPAAEAVADRVKEAGGRTLLIEADLSEPSAPEHLFDEAERAVGPIGILVNNAAHCESPDTILDVSAGSLDRHFAVNARAPTLLVHEFALRHRKSGSSHGRIINISTDAARAFATQIGYGASKAALEALTRSTAVELGSLGITVNAVAPGPVQTGWLTPQLERQVLPSVPLGRIGTPEDIADAVVFLASRQASWITGQVIQVAGGHAL